MTNLIQAIIFDFGRVVLEWDPHRVYRPFFQNDSQAIDAFLSEIDFSAWNLEQDRGRSFADGVVELSARFPQYAHLIRAYDERWEDSVPGPIQGTLTILRSLKQAGYLLYGLSNWSAEKFQIARKKYAFFDWFDDILISGEVGLIKPDAAIYRLLLQRIRRQPPECLFVDDALSNVAAAQKLGFATVHFQSPEQLENELTQQGVTLRGT